MRLYGACAEVGVCAPPGTSVTPSRADKPEDTARESAQCNAGRPDRGMHPGHPASRSALGIHDLAGNVREMTASVYRPNYAEAPLGGLYTKRGGSFLEGALPTYFLSTTRRNVTPTGRASNIGFRCAR